jgi:putative oxidoreductase
MYHRIGHVRPAFFQDLSRMEGELVTANKELRESLDRLQPLALLALRLVLGIIMIAHGYPKMFGGFPRMEQMCSDLGFPSWFAYLLVGTEVAGGVLVIAGCFTRFFSLAMLIDMIVAIWKIHWKNGLRGEGGYEFPLSLAVIAFALIFFGAGPFALDQIHRIRSSTTKD